MPNIIEPNFDIDIEGYKYFNLTISFVLLKKRI